MKLSVYSVIGDGQYGGGMAIVAASTPEEARSVAGTIRDDMWLTDYLNARQTNALPLIFDGEPCVIAHYETGE